MSGHPSTIRIPGAARLGPGETRVFPIPGGDEQGFAIGTPAGPKAWRNRCRHWPAPLDMDDGQFWNPDLRAIQCRLHGATYRPEDGFCTMGPCGGSSLQGWPVRIDGEDLLVDLD